MSCGSLMIPKVPVSNHLADADGDFVAVAASAAVPSQPVSPSPLQLGYHHAPKCHSSADRARRETSSG